MTDEEKKREFKRRSLEVEPPTGDYDKIPRATV